MGYSLSKIKYLSAITMIILVSFLPNAYAVIYSYQSISGFVVGGEPGDSYTGSPYAVSVSISKADLYQRLIDDIWIYVEPYYVKVMIFVNGDLKWQGYLAAGGSSPTITADYGDVLIVVKAPFSSSNYGVDYKGTITWIYS